MSTATKRDGFAKARARCQENVGRAFWVRYETAERVIVERFGRKHVELVDRREVVLGPFGDMDEAEWVIVDAMMSPRTVQGTAEIIEGRMDDHRGTAS